MTDKSPRVWPAVKGQSGVDVAIREWRELSRKEQLDAYGLALMMIREGAANPKEIAAKILEKWTDRIVPPLTPRSP